MSEFQYFEFRAVERSLSKDEQAVLRSFSSRAEIGARSFTNEYHWGDFKGDTIGWMKNYFDAHVYLSNFGSRALHLRIPLALLDRDSVRPYEVEDVLVVRQTATHLVLSIFSDDESGRDYDELDEEPSRVLDELLPLRDELARGDMRALYIVWLLGVRNLRVDENTPEPPMPDGLGQPSAALESLISFLWLDPELVEVAARTSASAPPVTASNISPESWLASLTAADKETWLVRLLTADDGHALHRFQHESRQAMLADLRAAGGHRADATSSRRLAVELLEAAEELAGRKREEAARKATEERLNYLRTLAGQEDHIWKSVVALTATSTPSNYDSAVRQLGDLQDLAKLTGQEAAFAGQLAELWELRRKKPSFIQRLNEAGLR